jgi:membrane-associated protein
METIFNFVCLHADEAQWIMFFLLLLAGFNIPISEDALLIIGGAISSTCVKQHPLEMWGWLFMGCWISAWEAYWIGRLLGPKLYEIRWFHRIINPSRIEKLRHYYEKFGIFTFIVGRFIPGGIRNALFMTTGLSKMPFQTFLLRDFFACLISSVSLFYLGYKFGENHELLLHYFKHYQLLFLSLIAALLATFFFVLWRFRLKDVPNNHQTPGQ